MKAWYLVHCKSRQDERAEDNLIRQDYACYRPQVCCERVVKGRRAVVSESLFPGYLFIQLTLEDNWGPLRSTRGVLRVVAFGAQPLVIGNAVIDELKRHENAGEVEAQLVSGEPVRITDGPFAELQAIYLRMEGEARVVVLLNFLQREQQIKLPLSKIAKF